MKQVMEYEKETTNTVRFRALDGDEPPIIDTVYLPKWVVRKLGSPQKIEVSVTEAEAPEF